METPEKTPWNPSRRATERVANPLPAPETCPHCGGKVEVVGNAEIYGGKPQGLWPWAYLCRGCSAHVGMHPYTSIPLGTLATEELRRARVQAKQPFETWYSSRKLDRSAGYQALADKLGIPLEQCHFGWFDLAMCGKAKAAAVDLLRTTPLLPE